MIHNVEAISTPENAAIFPVEELDMSLVNAIATIESALELMPSNPDQKHNSLYAFGTPEPKMRADNDDANPLLMAAVDATLGNVMSAGMGLSPQAAQVAGTMSNVAEGMSSFAKGNKPSFNRNGKKTNNAKPQANAVMKPTKPRGGKVKHRSAAQIMQERRNEVKRAEFKKTASKRKAMEKRANELYQMRAILNKYKGQGIRRVEVDKKGNKIIPLATGAKPLHRPSYEARMMQPPAPSPFKMG